MFGAVYSHGQEVVMMQKQDKRTRKQCTSVPRAEITVRLPVRILDQIQSIAQNCGVPSETLIKMWVAEKVLNREATSRRHHYDAY
jgi:hypothetical protein